MQGIVGAGLRVCTCIHSTAAQAAGLETKHALVNPTAVTVAPLSIDY